MLPQIIRVTVEHDDGEPELLSRREVHQPHESAMRPSLCNSQLAEVFVERDEDTIFFVRPRQNLVVPRIARPLPAQITS